MESFDFPLNMNVLEFEKPQILFSFICKDACFMYPDYKFYHFCMTIYFFILAFSVSVTHVKIFRVFHSINSTTNVEHPEDGHKSD
jgi:uncharacterized protein YhbP (UPF0306 family)